MSELARFLVSRPFVFHIDGDAFARLTEAQWLEGWITANPPDRSWGTARGTGRVSLNRGLARIEKFLERVSEDGRRR